MSRKTLVVLAFVVAALVAVIVGASHLVRRDRTALVNGFSEDRLQQVRAAAHAVHEDLDDLSDDLRFASHLVPGASSTADVGRELRALLGVVRAYGAAAVYDSSGVLQVLVRDPAPHGPSPSGFESAMDETARRALNAPAGEIVASPRIASDPSGWYRVFATPVPEPAGETTQGGAVALLVDTEHFFGPLRLLASEPTTDVLVVGPYGRPTPVSSPRLAPALGLVDVDAPSIPKFAHILDAMGRGVDGTVQIDDAEVVRLGLGVADLVVAFAPIAVEGGKHWSVATFSSTSVLRSQEQALLWRLGLAAAAVALTLVAFFIYVVVVSRRAVVLQERLRSADHLAHLHDKAEKILNHIPTCVLAISDDGRVTAMNRAARQRTRHDTAGESLAHALPDAPAATIARLDALLARARESARVCSLHGERSTLFGAEGQYSIHAVPLDPALPATRMLLVIEDFTEVRGLETQLLRAEKLATVGVLAAGIAHEVGTPLGVVRGRAEYLLTKLGGEHAQAPGVRVIVEQIDRVTRTLRELLDFSRVRPAAVSPVALAPAAHKVADLLRYEAVRRKVHVDVDVPDALPLLAADADQLEQVLVNVLLNACDACAPEGRVVLSARTEPDGASTGGRRIRLLVSDDGCGIAPEDLHRVFDPFFTTKKRGAGTGLGLTVVGQIVRAHGAEIELASEPGHGTQLAVLWPAAAPGTADGGGNGG